MDKICCLAHGNPNNKFMVETVQFINNTHICKLCVEQGPGSFPTLNYDRIQFNQSELYLINYVNQLAWYIQKNKSHIRDLQNQLDALRDEIRHLD